MPHLTKAERIEATVIVFVGHGLSYTESVCKGASVADCGLAVAVSRLHSNPRQSASIFNCRSHLRATEVFGFSDKMGMSQLIQA